MINKMLTDDFSNIISGHFLIKNIIRMNNHQWAKRTETVTTCFDNTNSIFQPVLCNFFVQRIFHFQTAGGMAACTAANQKMANIRLGDTSSIFLLHLCKLLRSYMCHRLSVKNTFLKFSKRTLRSHHHGYPHQQP